MNYFIKRDLNEYGPYSLADLQKYVASGNILLTDLCRSEGLTDWVPVSQVIGNIPVPAPPQTVAATAPGGYLAPGVSVYPPPPNLHWGICLLLGVVTCGVFALVWLMVQAVWIRKVQPASKAVIYVGTVIGLWAISFFLAFFQTFAAARTGHNDPSIQGVVILINLSFAVLWIVAAFSMRSSIEEHFNSAEPIGLSLSGVMTFFFNVYYFQYHFTQINEMKRRQMGYAI